MRLIRGDDGNDQEGHLLGVRFVDSLIRFHPATIRRFPVQDDEI